jgi:segregation and condensation protein A
MSDITGDEGQGEIPVFDLTMNAAPPGEAFIVDIDGFEGPLDLLLTLARSQKVDLRGISILQLVDQYIEFIGHLAKADLDLAADYLVMASWLAYLKSRLLLPKPELAGDEPSGEEMAARLAFRLQRLQAMREAGGRLMARDRLGRDVFFRGEPEGIRVIRTPAWADSIYDLLKAYSDQRTRTLGTRFAVKRAPVYAIDEARKRLEQMIGMSMDWNRLDSFLPDHPGFRELRRSALASTFSASLEMAKDGKLFLRQASAFGPLFLRNAAAGHADPANDRQSA